MLTLDRLDLLPEHAETNCSRTRFEHDGSAVRRDGLGENGREQQPVGRRDAGENGSGGL